MTDEPQVDQPQVDTRTPDQVLIDLLSGIELRQVDLTSPGQSLDVVEGVNLIVGPNNSGKSTLIAEILQAVNRHPGLPDLVSRKVVGDVVLGFRHSANQLYDAVLACQGWSKTNLVRVLTGEPHVKASAGSTVSLSSLNAAWNSANGVGPAIEFFATYLSADGRCDGVHPTSTPPLGTWGTSVSPLQRVWRDKRARRNLEAAFSATFGENLFINHIGPTVSLHIGRSRVPKRGEYSERYARDLEAMPKLEDQGHGIRAFLTIMLAIVSGNYTLILIDEPELFLHPPQARRLAEILFKSRHPGARIVISTHSSDIVQGFVSACEGRNLAITRMTRKGSINHLASISPEDVEPMYTDALLRRSMILDGLFYHGVVVCEAEGDCTFYSAVDDFLGEGAAGRSDLHFTYAQGNGRMQSVVRVLRGASVPTASIVDADTLLTESALRPLVEAHGGDYDGLKSRINAIESQVSAKHVPGQVNRQAAWKTLKEIFDPVKKPSYLLSDELDRANKVLKGKGAHDDYKDFGRAILNGQALLAFESIVSDLGIQGIFVVESGELESFYRKLTGSKPERLAQALTDGVHRKSRKAHKLVERVRAYLDSQQ